MPNTLMCAARPESGINHRFLMLTWITHFARWYGYSVYMLWGVTIGVAHCKFAELLAPIPGVGVINAPTQYLRDLEHCVCAGKNMTIGQHLFSLFRPRQELKENLFSWDLSNAEALKKLAPGWPSPLVAKLSPGLRAETDAFIHQNGVANRLGIRVRVEEAPRRNRKPHRIKKELDEVVSSITKIPWYTKVFIATDSEYVQQMLVSHFRDARFLPKQFASHEATGRYVHREDKQAMFTFLKEIDCLCRCRRIINIGGFLNDRSVEQKFIREPYYEAAYMHPPPH